MCQVIPSVRQVIPSVRQGTFRPRGNPHGSRVTERLEVSWGLVVRESSGLVLEEENSWEEDEEDEEEVEDEDDEDEEDEEDEHDFGDIGE